MAASEAARVAMAASQAWAVRDAWEATEHAFPQLVPVKKDCKTSLMMRCGAEHESVGEVARALHMAADATMRLHVGRSRGIVRKLSTWSIFVSASKHLTNVTLFQQNGFAIRLFTRSRSDKHKVL